MTQNDYSFLVERLRGNSGTNNYEQYLHCKCGQKQKCKLNLRRILLKNAEKVYEDKFDIETIRCNGCNGQYGVRNNLVGIKNKQSTLVEISFETSDCIVIGQTAFQLSKTKKYFRYDEDSDEVISFIVKDHIFYTPESRSFLVEYNQFEEATLNVSLEKNGLFGHNTKPTKKVASFELSSHKLLEHFFSYDSSINYQGLDSAFDFFDSIISESYDYEDFCRNKFVNDFKVSKTIHVEEKEGKKNFFIMKRDMFGGNTLIRKKIDFGDYITRLQKFSEICMVLTVFPNLSTLFKLKGVGFIYDLYKKGYLAPQKILVERGATSPVRILEVCCKYFHFENTANQRILTGNFQLKQEDFREDNFKLSPLLFRAIKEPEDITTLYKFIGKNLISKTEIESLFQKFEPSSVFHVMFKILNEPNIRQAKLTHKHISHMLRYDLLKESHSNSLSLYYDTMNSLSLIVEIIEQKKREGKSKRSIGKLTRISEDKLFDIKNFEKLKSLHDEMTAIYRALEDEGKDLKYQSAVKKFSKMSCQLNMFDFKVIPNLNELSKEGLVMHHCIYTYLNDIASGNYVAVRIKDLVSKERATLGIKIDGDKFYLQQLKGYYNSRATRLLIETCLDFCKKMNINIESNHLHNSDIQPNPSLEKRMKEYLDPEKANLLRKATAKKKNNRNLEKL
jgi:hypothetical protein